MRKVKKFVLGCVLIVKVLKMAVDQDLHEQAQKLHEQAQKLHEQAQKFSSSIAGL